MVRSPTQAAASPKDLLGGCAARSRGEALEVAERHRVEDPIDSNGTERIVGARIGEALPDSYATLMDATDDAYIFGGPISTDPVHMDSHRFAAEAHAPPMKATQQLYHAVGTPCGLTTRCHDDETKRRRRDGRSNSPL